MDELELIKEMHESQRNWRRKVMLSFIAILIISTFTFVVVGRNVSGLLTQMLMILSMLSITGLVFLDFISFMLNKKFFRQDIMREYLFTHSKPEDIHKDSDVVVELIKDRRAAAQKKKSM
ncbi:MAG TPA: hypothetical protein ENK06_11585 [Gammaproteobacteria bacterium]|nr:hypothetical protein [Gammaproteobacteria bacterium]